MTRFWFNKEEFSDDWFLKQNKQAIADLGRRYSPNIYEGLNVDISIKSLFAGLSRDETLKEKIVDTLNNIIIHVKEAIPSDDHQKNKKSNIKKNLSSIETSLKNIDFDSIEDIPINEFKSFFIDLDNELASTKNFYAVTHERGPKKRDYSTELYSVSKALDAVYFEGNFFSKKELLLANHPYLLIDGEAGVGKSHLLADVVVNRNKNGPNSLFLLGQHFVTNEAPWTQIKTRLEIDCSSDVF